MSIIDVFLRKKERESGRTKKRTFCCSNVNSESGATLRQVDFVSNEAGFDKCLRLFKKRARAVASRELRIYFPARCESSVSPERLA